MLQGPWKWGSSLFVLVIGGFAAQDAVSDVRIGKLLTKIPMVKHWLSFLQPAGINGVASSPNNKWTTFLFHNNGKILSRFFLFLSSLLIYFYFPESKPLEYRYYQIGLASYIVVVQTVQSLNLLPPAG